MPKPDHEMMMRLIRQHFNEEGQKMLTFTRWKDGIDVQYPVFAIEAFFEAVVAMERERVAKLGRTLGGVSTPRMEGDNLAIVLCGRCENPDQEENETGWTPDAVAGCDEVLAAIRRHYETP